MYNHHFLILTCLILSGCNTQQKKESKPLAGNYLEQSTLEAKEQNFKKALQLVNQSLNVEETPQALIHKGTLLYQLEKFNESLAIFEKTINMRNIPGPLKSDAKNNYACILNQLGKKEAAQKIWKELADDNNYLTPQVALYNLALLALARGDLEMAEKYLLKATYTAIDYVDAFFFLGVTQLHQKRWGAARDSLQTVLSLNSQHQAAQELLDQINIYEKKSKFMTS